MTDPSREPVAIGDVLQDLMPTLHPDLGRCPMLAFQLVAASLRRSNALLLGVRQERSQRRWKRRRDLTVQPQLVLAGGLGL